MADVIELKGSKSKKKRPIDFTALNKDRVPFVKRSPEEIEVANQKVMNLLKDELEASLEALIQTDKSSNIYLVKIRGDFAIRIQRYNLAKRLYQDYAQRGLYFHFELQTVDLLNIRGIVMLFWDRDYSKWQNRLKRKFILTFDSVYYVFSKQKG